MFFCKDFSSWLPPFHASRIDFIPFASNHFHKDIPLRFVIALCHSFILDDHLHSYQSLTLINTFRTNIRYSKTFSDCTPENSTAKWKIFSPRKSFSPSALVACFQWENVLRSQDVNNLTTCSSHAAVIVNLNKFEAGRIKSSPKASAPPETHSSNFIVQICEWISKK